MNKKSDKKIQWQLFKSGLFPFMCHAPFPYPCNFNPWILFFQVTFQLCGHMKMCQECWREDVDNFLDQNPTHNWCMAQTMWKWGWAKWKVILSLSDSENVITFTTEGSQRSWRITFMWLHAYKHGETPSIMELKWWNTVTTMHISLSASPLYCQCSLGDAPTSLWIVVWDCFCVWSHLLSVCCQINMLQYTLSVSWIIQYHSINSRIIHNIIG